MALSLHAVETIILAFVLAALWNPAYAQPGANECSIDVVFVVDNSESIRAAEAPGQTPSEIWDLILDFVTALILQLNVGPGSTHVGFVDFSNTVYLDFNLTTYTKLDDVTNAVGRVPYRGESSMNTAAAGLQLAETMLTNQAYGPRGLSVPKVIILITEGITTQEVQQLQGVVNQITNQGISFLAVAVSDQADASALEAIAPDPADFAKVANFSALSTAADIIIINSGICSQGVQPPATMLPTPPTTTAQKMITGITPATKSLSTATATILSATKQTMMAISATVSSTIFASSQTHLGSGCWSFPGWWIAILVAILLAGYLLGLLTLVILNYCCCCLPICCLQLFLLASKGRKEKMTSSTQTEVREESLFSAAPPYSGPNPYDAEPSRMSTDQAWGNDSVSKHSMLEPCYRASMFAPFDEKASSCGVSVNEESYDMDTTSKTDLHVM